MLAPDTSPRGEGVPNDEAYDFGQGAGFYVDADEAPWKTNFRMYSYVTRELHGLIAQNYDIRGYLHWTLTDNFEWNQGWHLRFGLVELNIETQERKLRPSARLYAEIAKTNGEIISSSQQSVVSS